MQDLPHTFSQLHFPLVWVGGRFPCGEEGPSHRAGSGQPPPLPGLSCPSPSVLPGFQPFLPLAPPPCPHTPSSVLPVSFLSTPGLVLSSPGWLTQTYLFWFPSHWVLGRSLPLWVQPALRESSSCLLQIRKPALGVIIHLNLLRLINFFLGNTSIILSVIVPH